MKYKYINKKEIFVQKMSRSITFGPNVGAISFEQPTLEPKELEIAGFGSNVNNASSPSLVLRKATVTLDDLGTCAGMANFNSSSMFCAGSKDSVGPCTADKGTPAVQNQPGEGKRVVGIVSKNLNCGGGTSTVFVMVSSYYNWIIATAGRPSGIVLN